jgi:hypothetical protein
VNLIVILGIEERAAGTLTHRLVEEAGKLATGAHLLKTGVHEWRHWTAHGGVKSWILAQNTRE